MRINARAALSTSKVLLVPYCSHHVPTYHVWMQDPELRAATASEPLSLNGEYTMQKSWRTDPDKLTFIVCLPVHSQGKGHSISAGDDPDRMIGDINLFLCFHESDDDADMPRLTPRLIGEIELMIARRDLHRQGFGRAALLTFLEYILQHWSQIAQEYGSPDSPLAFLHVKIDEANTSSLSLFHSVGFRDTLEGANYFGELELRWDGHQPELRDCRGWEAPSLVAYDRVEES